MDAESVRRWHGHDIDLTHPLTSAAVVQAAKADARIQPHIGGFLSMTELPTSLAPAEPLARAVYQSGWRPPAADGPTRDELVALTGAPASGTGPGRPTPLTRRPATWHVCCGPGRALFGGLGGLIAFTTEGT
jgi:hypothetical protein